MSLLLIRQIMFRVAWCRSSTVLRVNYLTTTASYTTTNGHHLYKHTYLNDYSLLAYYFDVRALIVNKTTLSHREVRTIVDKSGFFSFAMTSEQVQMFTENEPSDYAELITLDYIEEMMAAGKYNKSIKKKNSRRGRQFTVSNEASECWQLYFDLMASNEIVSFSDLVKRYKTPRDKEEIFYGVLPRSNVGELFHSDVSRKDFSPKNIQGIYVTKLISVAKRWALELEEVFGKHEVTVVSHTLPPGWREAYNGKVFRDGKFVEWQRFVTLAHAGRNDHRYDFVEGPFLNTMLLPEHSLYELEGDKVIPVGHQLAVFRPGLLKLFANTVKAYGDP